MHLISITRRTARCWRKYDTELAVAFLLDEDGRG